MNSCELVREWVVDCDWPEGGLPHAMEAIEHLQHCPQCTAMAKEFSRLRTGLHGGPPGVPLGGWNAMEQRLLAGTLRRDRRFPTGWLALAASVLIAAIGYGIGRWTMMPPVAPSVLSRTTPTMASTANVMAFSPSDIAHQVKAFDEVSGVFEHRTAWLLVGDETSDMGISDQVMASQHNLLLVRLTMLKSGKVISNADLAIVPGQSASLSVPADQNTSLSYRISTSSDQPTRLSIATKLMTPDGPEALAALATTLRVEPGQKLSVGNMVTNSGDYELRIAFGRANLDRPGRGPNS